MTPALRQNPRRAHLLVSHVLGKHVPVDPRAVCAAGRDLGLQVAAVVASAPVVVFGYAETATALGQLVADELYAPYVHSTRRHVAGARTTLTFDEEHSHATQHLVLPDDPALLTRPGVVVLVDDELSTGRTALNTIEALNRSAPGRRYVIAALVDVREDAARTEFVRAGARLGVGIEVVSLAQGAIELPDASVHAPEAAGRQDCGAAPAGAVPAYVVPADVVRIDPGWPADLPESARHGVASGHASRTAEAARAAAGVIAQGFSGVDVLVLGTEELMYAPLQLARHLADACPDVRVRFSSTTRSPVVVMDEPGYPIRTALRFPSHDDPADGPGPRFAYNVAPAAGEDCFSDIVVVVDAAADTAALHAPDGLLAQVAAVCRCVHLVALPTRLPCALPPEPLRGPRFGSYPAADVAWLITDLSHAELEAPTELREEAIQAGRAHYAESLPVEYRPGADYHDLFEHALEDSAVRLAEAVGVVTELVLAERGHDVVLASLARAGTPVGVLMRRWAAFAHGLDLPHYAVSIVRARGIDTLALSYLAARHDPSQVVFVDGWTGKGAIARELDDAVRLANKELSAAFDPSLAVLADSGSCVRTFGTRDDFLIPSACLNSTVSGLVSRTVLNSALTGPGEYHGAKYYRDLSDADVSMRFVDAVCARFAEVRPTVAAEWPRVRDSDRAPTWRGWSAVEELSAAYGIDDVNLVKPGVGETTRVLLRRVPWRILVRPDAATELRHVVLLAEERGVPLEQVPDLAFSCVGLIHPRFRRSGG